MQRQRRLKLAVVLVAMAMAAGCAIGRIVATDQSAGKFGALDMPRLLARSRFWRCRFDAGSTLSSVRTCLAA